MTDQEFTKTCTDSLKKLGATDIVVTADDGLLGARCKVGGKEYEMSMMRGQYDDRSKEMIVDAIGHFPAQLEHATT